MYEDLPACGSLKVSYEPIELHSQTKYVRKSFIDRFRVANNSKEDNKENSNFIEGLLFLDNKSHRLFFNPFDTELNELEFYRDNFHYKYSIEFRTIKQIIFYTRKNEYYLKTKDLPHKSFRSFSIFCHDFRVYNFNRLVKLEKAETIKFYQNLAKSLINIRKNTNQSIDWTTIDKSRLLDIYKENVNINIDIYLDMTEANVNFVPEVLCDRKKFKYNVQLLPQIVFYSKNNSFMILCEKPESKSLNDMCHRISKSITGKEVWPHSIFYLNEGNNSKCESISPSNKDLYESFEKLYSLCTPRNKVEFKRIDKRWQSKLAESGWLSLVNKCLCGLSQIVKMLDQQKSFVYLMENTSPTWSWFFVSLTQVSLQPSSRTIAGFSSLIKKNWIIANTCTNSDSGHHALFMLFLDCVYQFLRSSPLSFEFNEEMLICLYDLFVLAPTGPLMVFDHHLNDLDWGRFYVPEVTDCLINQCYDRETEAATACLPVPELECFDFECFWSKMYSRWIPYMQIESGGLSVRHYAMTYPLRLEHSVHSNYPFSLNYDKITKYCEEGCHDEDTHSINTIILEDY